MYTKEEVISTYRSLGSIKATAKYLGIGPQVVRRVVIELEGLLHSEKIR